MAKGLLIQGASPLCGSPITYKVTADTISGPCAFHRVNLAVHAALYGGQYMDLILSSPAESGETLTFDISSALRAVADSYEYTVDPPASYPYIVYDLFAHDEWMQNGEAHDVPADFNQWSTNSKGHKAIFGAYSDLERLLSSGTGATKSKLAQHFSRKPFSSPEVVAVGETMVLPLSFSAPVSEAGITTGPTSSVFSITKEGLQVLNGREVYALPTSKRTDRYEFRFVNGLGCLESVSVCSLRTTEMNMSSESFIRSIQETFGQFSRGMVRKSNDYETWKLSSGPLDIPWQSWFMHEFLMTKQAWVKVSGHWLPCHILADETVAGLNRQENGICEVQFSVQLDINGSPLASLAI